MVKTTTPYEELKNQLSAEKSKPKSDRNLKLIESLHSQINDHKRALQVGFKKRMKEKHKEEVASRLKLEKKQIARYTKMRKEKLKKLEKQRADEQAKLNGQGKKKEKSKSNG